MLPKGNKNRRQFISRAQPNIKSERKKYWRGRIKKETKKTQAVKDREKMRQQKKKKKKRRRKKKKRSRGRRRKRRRNKTKRTKTPVLRWAAVRDILMLM